MIRVVEAIREPPHTWVPARNRRQPSTSTPLSPYSRPCVAAHTEGLSAPWKKNIQTQPAAFPCVINCAVAVAQWRRGSWMPDGFLMAYYAENVFQNVFYFFCKCPLFDVNCLAFYLPAAIWHPPPRPKKTINISLRMPECQFLMNFSCFSTFSARINSLNCLVHGLFCLS